MAMRMIQVGTGGFGGKWCSVFLPANIADGTIEVVAAVDKNSDALQNAKDNLGLTDDKLYTDAEKAFDENPADFCTIVVPPAFHESIVDLALSHDMHILSEKPIADTMESSCRIAKKVESAGKKMGVTMSHRFRQDVTTLREEIRSGKWGRLDYLSGIYTIEGRKFGTWGKFRHEIPDPLMIEGSVHHLDILADMAGDRCISINADLWNPEWGEYAGNSQGLVTMRMQNGVRAAYEGASTNAVGLYPWLDEYIRAECELGTLIMHHRKIEAFRYNESKKYTTAMPGEGEELPLIEQNKWENSWLIEKFVRWLDGGEPMETNVSDNLQSVALIFAAIESARTNTNTDPQSFLEDHLSRV